MSTFVAIMPPKNTTKQERRRRNSSRGRSPAKDPSLTGSNSGNDSLQVPGRRSPENNAQLPVNKVNKGDKHEGAHKEPAMAGSEEENTYPPKNSLISSDDTTLVNEGERCPEGVLTSPPSPTGDEVKGSNDNKKIPHSDEPKDPKDPEDLSPLASDKTMKLVLAELREIKSTMSTLR